MNSITMKLQADELIRLALQEDITSEDVSTNAEMPTAQQVWMSMPACLRYWIRQRL